jgi:hypothetical protein
MSAALKDPGLRPVVLAALAPIEDAMKLALGPALGTQMPKLLSEAIEKSKASLKTRDWAASATGLARDLGLAGKLSDAEIKALAGWLKQEAAKTLHASETLAGHSKELSPFVFLSAYGAQMKTSLGQLQQLRAEFTKSTKESARAAI